VSVGRTTAARGATCALLLVTAWSGLGAASNERVVDRITVERLEADPRFEPLGRFTAPGRPTVALALSGGGSRGLAHLGAVDAMLEDGVEIDAIAGTSIGSLIGAFLAGGYRPLEVREILQQKNWDVIVSGLDVRRRVLTRDEELLRSAQVSFGLRRGKRLAVGALADASALERELYRYLLRAQLDSGGDFDRLRYRYRPVGVDILTGRLVVPERGDLVSAVRGSSAVPGVFAPVPFGDALLVDGGLLQNIPVDAARSMGTDLVVASNTSGGVAEADTVSGAADVLKRSLVIMSSEQDAELLTRADAVLTHGVSDFPQASFGADIDGLIDAGRAGYRAARETMWERLEAACGDRREVRFGTVEVAGTDWIDAATLAARLGGAPGTVTRYRVAAELARALNRGPIAEAWAEAVDRGGERVLRFTFREHPPVRAIETHVGVYPAGSPLPELLGHRFSRLLAREIQWRSMARMIESGRALVRLDSLHWDPADGSVSVRLADDPVDRIRTSVEGEIRLERVQRYLDDLEGPAFTLDRLANRLDELKARGALFDWKLEPVREPDGTVSLATRVRGDDYFQVSAAGAYRGQIGGAGFLRGAKSNFTGRGDFVDLIVRGSQDVKAVQLRYRTEYGIAFQNLGAEIGVRYFDNAFLTIDPEDQDLEEDDDEEVAGNRYWLSLIRRLRLGAVVQLGVFRETNRFDATDLEPALRTERTSALLEFELNRHERLLFPRRGAALFLWAEKSFSGDSLWRVEANTDVAIPLGGDRQVLTPRFGLGLSEDAERRPYWFDPGGHRELYGFIPYGAAAPQYARAGVTWRYRFLDKNLARLYVEAGTDWITTSIDRGDLGDDGGTVGYGMSLVANARGVGPIAVGLARNDDGAETWFFTVGFPLPR
jgi:predicted acylesterase/phospholipase RssA